MRATRLRTEHMRNPMGIDVKKPLLSWCCEAGISQTAFQIIAKRDDIQRHLPDGSDALPDGSAASKPGPHYLEGSFVG